MEPESGGGGGGGSSFVVADATNVSSGLSARTGDGQVTITYDPATDRCSSEDDGDDDGDDPAKPKTASNATPAVAIVAEARFTG